MSAACIGFFGKIPARGDFVRSRLPSGFVLPWDAWLQQVLSDSRELMGADWLPAWLEAPVWRFALDGGLCGPDPVLGVWMPSVDRAGRHFPLTLAAVVPGACTGELAEHGADWLAAAERAGLEAIECDTTPEQLALTLDAVPCPEPEPQRGAESGGSGSCREDNDVAGDGCGRWWTDGSPRVAARRLETAGLPDGITFAAMLDDRSGSRE